jgi:hypothetical protein
LQVLDVGENERIVLLACWVVLVKVAMVTPIT